MESERRLPPTLEQAKLPPLPPTRREREAAEADAKEKIAKIPLVTVKSAPNILEQPPVDRDLPPKMPPRPSGPPRMPLRPTGGHLAEEEQPPPQPPRRLPPPTVARSALSMGFGQGKSTPSSETPNPAPQPTPTTYIRPTGPAVQELTASNFDRFAMSGKAAFVDFYTSYCKYCKELDPIWKKLGEDFAFASDKFIIAKADVETHKSLISRFPDIQGYPTLLWFDGQSETPEKYPYMRDYESLSDFISQKTGINVSDGANMKPSSELPPPVNLSSKPSFANAKAIQSRPAPAASPTSGCLLCRDFSGPDQVASQYPRQSLPRNGDQTGYLADVLCGPFTSSTDKARAIFTWLHHNIAYDTVAFFGNNVKHVDPKGTITSGLAVCGGYAGLFSAIALKAGLEAVMVTGHGKGYGYTALKPGDPIPPYNPAGHAWNAVRIDGGEWKLLDACWGAGHVKDQVYNKKFTPLMFTMSNEDFGLKHFPPDNKYFFRSDGRIPSWEEYMLGPDGAEPLQLFSSIEDHGLSGPSFLPALKHIKVNSNEVIRFQFSKICEHWDHEKNGQGKPYCMVLKINGLDGRKDDFVAMENNEMYWWADVKARDLGAPGQTVSCFAVTTVNGKDARGMTRREYLGKKGRCGFGFAGMSAWELV